MKKIAIHFIIFSASICLTTSLLSAQDRVPFLVHGANSTSNDWDNWRVSFEIAWRFSNPSNKNYTTNAGVPFMANQVANNIPAPLSKGTIYFGYDLGGLVARHLDVYNSGAAIGGYITHGSALTGANIITRFKNGDVDNFINNGINNVLEGPRRDFSRNYNDYTLPGAYPLPGQPNLGLDRLVVGSIINDIRRLARFYLQPNQTLNDLQPGSAYLNSIGSAYGNKPHVTIYGNAQSPVLWRTASSFVGGIDDYNLIYVNRAVNYYQSMRDMHITNGWLSAVFIPFFGLFIGGNEFYIADGWGQGCEWWANGSETGWNDLIGTSIPSYKTVTYSTFDYNQFSQCMYNSGGYGSGYVYNRYSYCQQQATRYNTYYYYSPVNGTSDGLIPASSQIGFSSNWGGTQLEARNINHFQFKTDNRGSLNQLYLDLFVGNTNADNFFKTERK